MEEIELLTGALDGIARVIEGIGDDQLGRPTPCPDHDVGSLVDHVLPLPEVPRRRLIRLGHEKERHTPLFVPRTERDRARHAANRAAARENPGLRGTGASSGIGQPI
jgi:hypothetical protein